MKAHIVDTTLRDGEQKAGIALGINEKVQIAKLLDSIGVYQIESGIPAMKGTEKRSIQKIMELGLKSKISSWNRMDIGDINHSIDCGVQIIHITAPVSDLQIVSKLQKDKNWVIDNMKKCIYYIKEKGFEVTVGLEDASRADFAFLLEVASIAYEEGADRIRYADTVGILHSQRIYNEIWEIKNQLSVGIEIHAHNDLGMAVANSISAVKAGAEFVDCTIGGIGERAGNCNYTQFVEASRECLDINKEVDLHQLNEVQEEIFEIIRGRKSKKNVHK